MKISEICSKTGMTKDTIRFYEKLGLLTKVNRRGNGYKDYADTHVEQLNLIKHAKELGFTLEEINQLATLLFTKQLTTSEMLHFLTQKEEEIDNKIRKLQQFKVQINDAFRGHCEFKANLKNLLDKQ